MAGDNYVTYYQGQRVEITRDVYNRFVADNGTEDIPRIGQAFANDNDNLALGHSVLTQATHPDEAVHASPGMLAPAGPVYAVPTPLKGNAADVMPAASDAQLTASGSGGGFNVPAAASPTIQVLPALAGGIPTWAYIAAALALVVIFMERRG